MLAATSEKTFNTPTPANSPGNTTIIPGNRSSFYVFNLKEPSTYIYIIID
jgi:hypothetical protein